MIDPWPYGYIGSADHSHQPAVDPAADLDAGAPDEHGYARPVEGLIVTVDLDAMKVLEVDGPRRRAATSRTRATMTRADVRPEEPPRLHRVPRTTSSRSRSPSPRAQLQVDGSRGGRSGGFSVGFNPREGLVLHTIATRPGRAAARSSIARRCRSSSSPTATRRRRTGQERLRHGRGGHRPDCQLSRPSAATAWARSATSTDGHRPAASRWTSRTRSASTRRTTACSGSTPTSAPRGRGPPVPTAGISTIATVGNYEYGFFWYLYQDGTIQYEVKLTGIISNGAVAEASSRAYGVAGRARCLRPQPPALLQRAARHDGRRRRELGLRGRQRGRCRGPREPARQRLGTASTAGRERVRGAAVTRTRVGPLLEGRQPGGAQRAR